MWEASGQHCPTALPLRLSGPLAPPRSPDVWGSGSSLQKLWEQVAFAMAQSSLLSLGNFKGRSITFTDSVQGNEESKTLVMRTIMSQIKGIYVEGRALALSFECRDPPLSYQRDFLDRNISFARVFAW